MKKEIKVILPTRNQADEYFKRNGYPDGMSGAGFTIEECREMNEIKEAILNGYDFLDVDCWTAIENLIKSKISFEDAMKINNILWENDISVLDLI